MIAIVCGDRNWVDSKRIKSVLKKYKVTTVIQGECKGADKLAAQNATKLGLKIISCPADWEKYGKAAGPIRNKSMLKYEPQIVLAFHNNIDASRGTINMRQQAKKAGVKCYLVTDENIVLY